MRTYFLKLISLSAVAISMMLSACGGGSGDDPKPEPDTTKPVIDTTLPKATGQEYPLGGSFLYKGTFTDNEGLMQVVFTLSDNKPASSASLKGSTGVDDEPWTPSAVTVALSGKSQILDQAIFEEIPNNDIWTGVYTLSIECTDEAGNSSSSSIDVTIQ